MLFTITKTLAQPPSYPTLLKLAGQNQVLITGNEQHGSFLARGGAGDYEFGKAGVKVNFTGPWGGGELFARGG